MVGQMEEAKEKEEASKNAVTTWITHPSRSPLHHHGVIA